MAHGKPCLRADVSHATKGNRRRLHAGKERGSLGPQAGKLLLYLVAEVNFKAEQIQYLF